MPRTRSIAWSQLRVGIITVVALLLVTALVFAVGGASGFFWQRYQLRARFPDAQGLKAGAVVRVNGKEVGTVTSVEFSGAELEVGLELLKEVQPLITTESQAKIGSLSLLGEPIVDITGGRGGRPLAENEVVKAAPPAGTMADLTTSASNSLQQMEGMLADIRAGRGTMGKLITDDALYAELQQFVASAGDVTRAINQGRGTIGGLINDPAAYQSLKASLDNLNAITARINSGQGPLGRLLNDDAMGRSMAGASANVEQITGRLSKGEGTAGKLLTDQALYDRLNSMTSHIDAVVGGLEQGRGTAGQLLHDQQLYENMNRAVTELRDLLAAVRQNPQKYLRVNVSIF
jgi:phospholipid/cholesterol/gamma-HCH transport system substrate-binding protein